MLRLKYSIVKRLCSDFRRILGIRSHESMQPIEFTATENCLIVRSVDHQCALTIELPGQFLPTHFIAPLSLFGSIKNCRASDDVCFTPKESIIHMDWPSHCVPQSKSIGQRVAQTFPPQPTWLVSNPISFLESMREAALTTDPDSARYALGCIRLRGSDGQVAATDGRQLVAFGGYTFPLEEVLITGEPLAKLRAFADIDSVSIGKSDDWLTVRFDTGTELWQLDLAIKKDGRFPNVDHCIPKLESAQATLTLSDTDASFLVGNLKALPGNADDLAPITLDLGPQTVIRAKAADEHACQLAQSSTVEVQLETSHFEGQPTCYVMNRNYLSRALQLGFRHIHFADDKSAFCRTSQLSSQSDRAYTFALLDKSAIVKSKPTDVRISTIHQPQYAEAA